MSTSFDDLLQDAEQMSAQIDKENSGMPRLQRTLGQLIEFNKRKLARTTGGSTGYLPSSDSNEINASILLAARGIDAPKLTQTIESLVPPVATISATTTLPSQANQAQSEFSPFEKFANMEYLRDVDLASFLKSEREQALMQLINESRERQSEAVEEAFEQASENEWEKQKQRIMNELLGTFGSSSTDLNSTPAVTLSTIGTSRQSNMTRTLMTDVEMEFAKQVFIYNQRLIESNIGGSTGGKGDLLQTFRGLSQRLNDKNLEEAWDMLYFMSGGSSSELSRQNDETEQSIDRSNSAQMQAFFVAQAVGYLERCFRDIVQAKVSANLKQARLGGQLGTLPLCSAYLRLSVSEKYHLLSVEKFDGDGSGQQQPLWPTIYLCLRCGDAEAARNVALRAKKDDVALYLDEILKDASARSLGHLSQSSENKLKIEYKSRIRRDQDVYKRAVYSFLCRYSGDDESIKDVLDNVDDFLWFKLNSILITGGDGKQAANTSLVRESSGITGESTLSFADFQAKMSIEFGEKYFVKNRNPFTYLQVLLLTAQFELAIEFMLKFETLLVHAVHMALGLYERGLLNVLKSSHSSQLISCVETPSSVGDSSKISIMRRVNLPSLIRMYTRKFECSDPREALQYYYFLRALRLPTEDAATVSASSSLLDPTLPRIDNYFAKFVCELALETREFEMLFGCLEKNAVRRPGLVDKFVGSNEREVDAIIGLVANEMDQRGLVEEAIKLFDLSKQHKRVFELCNKLLNQVVTEVNVPNSTRDRIKSMILSIALRYKTETNMSARAIPTSVVYTFYLLTDLMQFFDLYHEENWEIAYETLCKLSILPTTSLQVESKVKDFVAFSEEIKRNFPELLLAAMTIISNLYAKLNKTSINSPSYQNIGSLLLGGNNEKKMYLNQLKENAKALIKFVGCIPYRLSGDINARLLQLEVMMN